MKIEDIDRETKAIECGCGGYAGIVDCTEDECNKYGCGRDVPGRECCARAFVCKICGKRFVGAAPAPDMDNF